MTGYIDDPTAADGEPFPEMRMLAYGLICCAIVVAVLAALLIGYALGALDDPGTLTACVERGLRGAECAALAQEGL